MNASERRQIYLAYANNHAALPCDDSQWESRRTHQPSSVAINTNAPNSSANAANVNVPHRVASTGTGTRRAARRKKLNIMPTIHEDNEEGYEDDDVSAAVAVAALPIVTAAPAPEVADVEPVKQKSTFASGGHTNKKMRFDSDRPFHPGYSTPKKKRALHLRGNGGRRRRGRKQRLGKKLATGTGPMIFPVIENEAAPPVADILNNGAPDELEVAEEDKAAPPVADILLEVGTNKELEVAEALVEFGAAVADVEEEVVEDAALIANVVVAAAAEEETVDAGEEVVDSNGEAGEVVAARNANGNEPKPSWTRHYNLLVRYKSRNGHCNVHQNHPTLGHWIHNVSMISCCLCICSVQHLTLSLLFSFVPNIVATLAEEEA